jgi:hypothetical protein
MAIEGLTKEEAQKKLDENKAISAQLKSQIGSSKEMILTMAIKSGESDAGLINLGFDQVTIDTFREKIKIGNLKEELKKTIAEQAEETKKTNEEQAEVIKQSIEEHLEKKEAEEEARNASTLLGKKLRKVGLKEKDFESIPEWATLTEPQKMLVIEQASQQIFVDVKKEGEKRFNEKNKINGTFNVFKWRPSALGKVWKKIWKSSYVNSQSKEALEDFRSGKLKPDEEVLGALTKRMSELNLKVIDNAGKPSIEFIQIDPAMSPEVKEAVEKYNMKKQQKISAILKNFNKNLVEIKFIPNLEVYFFFNLTWHFDDFLNRKDEELSISDWLICETINQTETYTFYKLTINKTIGVVKDIDDILMLIDEFLQPITEQLKKEEALNKIIEKERQKADQRIEKLREKFLK